MIGHLSHEMVHSATDCSSKPTSGLKPYSRNDRKTMGSRGRGCPKRRSRETLNAIPGRTVLPSWRTAVHVRAVCSSQSDFSHAVTWLLYSSILVCCKTIAEPGARDGCGKGGFLSASGRSDPAQPTRRLRFTCGPGGLLSDSCMLGDGLRGGCPVLRCRFSSPGGARRPR